MDAIEAAARLRMPPTIHTGIRRNRPRYQDSLASEPALIAAALIAVYIVLGVLYESYIHPFTILSTLPSAGSAHCWRCCFFHTDLSIIAMIGIILFIGIVKKNAIMMIDFALAAERNEGKSSRDAIYQACLLRFRPILMTTHGGAARRRAARARNRRRVRASAAAGDHHHRRPGRQPAADPVHDAGRLSGPRPFPARLTRLTSA